MCAMTRAGAASISIESSLSTACARWGPELACVDMPIGLSESGVRGADMAAKGLLGRWNARVFLTPCRGVFEEVDYAAANAASRAISGKGLSKQMWHIMPKIREVDEAMRDERVRAVVRECHPEVCFWGLGGSTGGSVIGENKKTPEGLARRMAVLARYVEGAEDLLADVLRASSRRDVAADDVVDAMVCAVTAAGVWDGSLRTLPEEPARDGRGLAMEMVYRDAGLIGG